MSHHTRDLIVDVVGTILLGLLFGTILVGLMLL